MLDAITVKVKGLTPLLMHNGILADPLSPQAKALSAASKKKKTDADLMETRRLEFLGSLYLNDAGRPCIPGDNIEALLITAAKRVRSGEKAKAGIMAAEQSFELGYVGPKTASQLWDDENFRFVKAVKLNGKVRIMRTRPIFRSWSLVVTVNFDTGVVNKSEVQEFWREAQMVGIGDWKPRYGRFEVAS